MTKPPLPTTLPPRYNKGIKVVISLLALFIVFVYTGLQPFLSENEPAADAQVLVVEGWLTDYALKAAMKEFRSHPYQVLVTTGGPIRMEERCRMEQNGSLIFKILPKVKHSLANVDSTLLVRASGMVAAGEYAHFKVFINHTLVGSAYTSAEMRTYAFPVHGATVDTNMVLVEFDNDAYINTEHRNLIVYSIHWCGKEMPSTGQSVVYDIGEVDNKDTTTFHYPTYAAICAYRLEKLGFDPHLIKQVPATQVKQHKTYSYALALANWVNHSELPIHSINIFSRGIHARRSRLLYQKAMGSNFQIGVISTPEKEYRRTWWESTIRRIGMIREGIGVLYYQFFF